MPKYSPDTSNLDRDTNKKIRMNLDKVAHSVNNIDNSQVKDDAKINHSKIDFTGFNINTINSSTTITSSTNTVVFDIGDWDMDTTSGILVDIPSLDHDKVRSVDVLIREDTFTNPMIPLNFADASSVSSGSFKNEFNGTGNARIRLTRYVGGVFNTTSYNSTSYNRGYITIVFVE